MDPSSFSWTLPVPRATDRSNVASESPVAAALGRCRPLFRRSVLVVVAPAAREGWEAVRIARDQGARVTALCPAEQATEARSAGAEVILDPARTDPTWYRGAWSVIFDPAGGIGFRRAMASLAPDGVYLTSWARPADRARALLARLRGGPRLLRSLPSRG
jgi:NADPH:quinone reductase-like Zn-dependent oxidoreductase